MSVKIGHASISENGSVNGTKGDSTGREVCIRDWYNKPWDFIAIHPKAAVREKHAKAIEAACKNNNIGYGWGNRNTLNALAKSVKYDLSKVGKCNCDCSSLQNVAAVASGASGVTYGSNGWTTSTMESALRKAGYKIITARKFIESAAYCVRGAIYVKAGSHTVCGLSNGSKADETLEKAGLSTKSDTKKKEATSGGAIKAGKTVKLKASAKKYATGETIPSWVKSKKYTVSKVSEKRALLKEITSWVNLSDLELVKEGK